MIHGFISLFLIFLKNVIDNIKNNTNHSKNIDIKFVLSLKLESTKL